MSCFVLVITARGARGRSTFGAAADLCACMAPIGRRSKHSAADDDGWQQVASKKVRRVAQRAADAAYEKALSSQKGRGAKDAKGNQSDKGHHGIRPRGPARDGDPKPGVVVYDASDSSRCSFTYHGKLFTITSAPGGWGCPICAMPSNLKSRTHCGVCGAKRKEDAAVIKGNGGDDPMIDAAAEQAATVWRRRGLSRH